MKVVGLCGGSGSGKGLVCSFFSDFNVKCIDTDKVYHDMISTDSECTKELVAYFGEYIYARPGVDRARLRDVVFRSMDNLKVLNEISHKYILSKVRQMIEAIKREGKALGIVVDAPLLFESRFNEECDTTIAVIADEKIRIERIISRDSITNEAAVKRISSQISNEDLAARCDYVIENNSTPDALKCKVYELTKALFEN